MLLLGQLMFDQHGYLSTRIELSRIAVTQISMVNQQVVLYLTAQYVKILLYGQLGSAKMSEVIAASEGCAC